MLAQVQVFCPGPGQGQDLTGLDWTGLTWTGPYLDWTWNVILNVSLNVETNGTLLEVIQ